ncbi:MAG: cobaltochelatase subunit CobN [Halanaerobiales bacterium]|nr:cobaltochelatase subunit CobN [Halanaerobiales bacterium]
MNDIIAVIGFGSNQSLLKEVNELIDRFKIKFFQGGILKDKKEQESILEFVKANLPESIEKNFIKKHCSEIVNTLMDAGINENLERRSTIRIFGDPPGTYGAGVDLALKASAWKDEKDLAKIFIYFSSHAYGKDLYGKRYRHEFVENVNQSKISYDLSNSKRLDIFSCSFGASVNGGFSLIKKVMKGKEMKQYHGSREDINQIKVSTLKDKIEESLEKTLFNPLWKETVKEKGYRGASEFMQKMQNIFEWQCLTDKLNDHDLDRLVEEYINDPEMREWFNQHNYFAIEEIARRFLELHQRGKWEADPDILDSLKMSYIQIEGNLEENIGEAKGEIQGGTVEIITDRDIKEWQEKLKEIDI